MIIDYPRIGDNNITYILPLGSCLQYLGLDRDLGTSRLWIWICDANLMVKLLHLANRQCRLGNFSHEWKAGNNLEAKPSTLLRCSFVVDRHFHPPPSSPGHNMSVLGSQVDVDMDESVPDPVPKHQGHTGTGCYKLHDHEFLKHRHRPPRKGGTGEDEGPGRPNGGDGLGAPANGGGGQHNNTNLIDLPVDMPGGQQPNPVQLNSQYHQQLKTKSPPAQRTPVSTICSISYVSIWICELWNLLLYMFTSNL